MLHSFAQVKSRTIQTNNILKLNEMRAETEEEESEGRDELII